MAVPALTFEMLLSQGGAGDAALGRGVRRAQSRIPPVRDGPTGGEPEA
jgi:hypothetical protein